MAVWQPSVVQMLLLLLFGMCTKEEEEKEKEEEEEEHQLVSDQSRFFGAHILFSALFFEGSKVAAAKVM